MSKKSEGKEALFDVVFACSCIIYAMCCITSVVLTVIQPTLFWGPLAIAVISLIGTGIFWFLQKRLDKEEREIRKAQRKAKKKNKIV